MLAEFQSRFAHMLLRPMIASTSRDDAAVAVYRNTVMKGLVDALAANFPTVQRLVGDEWFTGAAARFAREHSPSDCVLAQYGEGFAAFLEHFPPTCELPYLADVARLDRWWMEAYFAADATPLTAQSWQLDQQALFNTRVTCHPTARFDAFPHSAASIWLANQPALNDGANAGELEVDGEIEPILIVRPAMTVRAYLLSSGELLFLKQLHAAATLGEAAIATLRYDERFPLAASLARLIGTGVFASFK